MRTIRNIAAIIIAATVIAGCALFERGINNPLNAERLAQVEAAYGLVLSGAVAYRRLYQTNRCTTTRPESLTNICARRSVVDRLRSADRQAITAIRAARRFVQENPTIDASAVISAAQIAVEAFRSTAIAGGVRGIE